MQETWVRSLHREDSLENVMATHSSILAWGIPWTEVPDGLQSMWLQRVRYDWVTNTFTVDVRDVLVRLFIVMIIFRSRAWRMWELQWTSWVAYGSSFRHEHCPGMTCWMMRLQSLYEAIWLQLTGLLHSLGERLATRQSRVQQGCGGWRWQCRVLVFSDSKSEGWEKN